jgi:carbon-monoxide dehydrogenase medium subunit
MSSLRYTAPESMEGACSLLSEYGDEAQILSGGQSLVPSIRRRVAPGGILIDINNIADQGYIERNDDQLCLGCLVRHTDVVESPVVAETNPVLADVAGSIGDVQVRNRGTLCGAIAQAHPAGDPPTIVVLFDADIVVTTADGQRLISGASFYTGSGETKLESGELISEVRFDIPGDDAGAGYAKWTPAEGSYPIAAAGALLKLDGDVISDARVITGAVEGVPTEMQAAAERLVGAEPTDDRLSEAAKTVGENTTPVEDFEGSPEFKRELAVTMTKDALDTALERAAE